MLSSVIFRFGLGRARYTDHRAPTSAMLTLEEESKRSDSTRSPIIICVPWQTFYTVAPSFASSLSSTPSSMYLCSMTSRFSHSALNTFS